MLNIDITVPISILFCNGSGNHSGFNKSEISINTLFLFIEIIVTNEPVLKKQQYISQNVSYKRSS